MSFDNFTSADWQNFVYLSLLAVILISSLATRREFTLSKIIKYSAMWLGVFILLITIYSYRFEFIEFKNRISSEINPSKPQVKNRRQIILKAAQDGHFYLNSKINGKEIILMVDTGASNISLTLNDAKKIGIDIKELIFNQTYQTANGITYGAAIKINELEIADIKFQDVKASINKGDMKISLIGINFLKKLKKYEFYQDQLILTIF